VEPEPLSARSVLLFYPLQECFEHKWATAQIYGVVLEQDFKSFTSYLAIEKEVLVVKY
jgi:hypothetical protein